MKLGAGKGRIGKVEQHLDERQASLTTVRPQFFHELLKRNVLVRIGVERQVPHLSQQVTKRQLTCHVRSQHQRIDEGSDQLLDLETVTVSDRGANDQVLLLCEAVEEPEESGQEYHVQGNAFAHTQLLETIDQRPGQVERHMIAFEGMHRQARPVCRQGQDRQIDKFGLPMRELFFQHRTGEPSPLPLREVRILNSEIRLNGKRSARAEGIVGRDEFPRDDSIGPLIGDDVMRIEDHDLIFITKLDQKHAQKRSLFEIKRSSRLRGRKFQSPWFAQLSRHSAQILLRPSRVQYVLNDLTWLTVHVRKGGPERVMAPDQFSNRPSQGRLVERTMQPDAGRDVIGHGIRRESIEEPHPLLRERQRKRDSSSGSRDHVPTLPLMGIGSGLCLCDDLGQGGNRRTFENLPERERDAEQRLDSGYQLCGEERMPTQFKEVIMHADVFELENFPPDIGQDLFRESSWRQVLRGQLDLAGATVRGNLQRLSIHLAVHRQRKRFHLDEGRGNHVRWQLAAKLFAQLHQSKPIVRTWHHERYDPLVSGLVLPYLDYRPLQIRMPVQDGLDFFQFDPVAANLDLAIGSAPIIQLPVGSPSHQVACTIQSGSRLLGKWIGNELSLRKIRPAPIAARDSDATDIELPRHAHWNRLLIPIQYEDGRVRNGASDWQIADQFIVRLRTGQIRPGDRNSRFRWPIGIDQSDGRPDQVRPALHDLRQHSLATDDHRSDGRRKRDLFQRHPGNQLMPVGRGQIQDRQVQVTAAIQKAGYRIDHRRGTQH